MKILFLTLLFFTEGKNNVEKLFREKIRLKSVIRNPFPSCTLPWFQNPKSERAIPIFSTLLIGFQRFSMLENALKKLYQTSLMVSRILIIFSALEFKICKFGMRLCIIWTRWKRLKQKWRIQDLLWKFTGSNTTSEWKQQFELENIN